MAFDVPDVGSAAFASQARWFSTDVDILVAGIGGDGVVSGCAVTAQGSPNNTVAVAAGTVQVGTTLATVTGGNVTMTAAHATNPRIDLITVNDSGTKAYTAGTAASDPAPPAIPASSVVLAAIYVPANDNVINSNQITDKRAMLFVSTASSLLTARTTGDDTNSSSQTPADDDELIVAIAANAILAFDISVQFTEATNANVSYNIGTPSGGSKVFHHEFRRASDGTVDATAMAQTGVQSNINIDAGAGGSYCHIWGVVTNGSTAGNVKLQWARGQAAGSVTRKSGSYMTAVDVT